MRPGDFKAVFDDAPLRAANNTILFLARPNALEHPRLGLVIAKKHIKRAVDRNRVKRLIRESFRKHDSLKAFDVIVLARKGLNELDNPTINQLLQQLWAKLNRKADQLSAEA